nr:PREDICTED: uncharacterized protein LOC103314788 [Tribolium castaneum]|eukprot:XP_015840003.1 PREDICTED: uncharacterized protein LOC103314788 [Tribolium castaneum]
MNQRRMLRQVRKRGKSNIEVEFMSQETEYPNAFKNPKLDDEYKCEIPCSQVMVLSQDSPSSSSELLIELPEDVELEKAMSKFADEMDENMKAEELSKIKNEKYRLLDETVIPITKSGSKFSSVGVKPFEDYLPVIKISNPQLTAATSFIKSEFEEFVKKMRDYAYVITDVDKEIPMCELKNYRVVLCKNKSLGFIPKFEDVYKPSYLSVETVQNVISVSDLFFNLLDQRIIKQSYYNNYEHFIDTVALDILQNGGGEEKEFENTVKRLIVERFESSSVLYEIFFKFFGVTIGYFPYLFINGYKEQTS